MRAVLFLSLLGACGRVGFESPPDGGSGEADGTQVTYAEAVLADQPRFYYRLDELAGDTVAHDATGHGDTGHVGVYSGGTAMFGVPGALSDGGTAIRLDGDGNAGSNSGAAVELDTVGTTWAGDFTIEMFFKQLQPTPGCCSVNTFLCEEYMMNGFRTGIRTDQRIHLWTDEAGGTSSIFGAAAAVVGTWQHIAYVKRGSNVEIYVDGVQTVAAPVDYIATSATSPAVECGLGAFHGLPAHGVYDEVAVYETALPATRIAAHFAAR